MTTADLAFEVKRRVIQSVRDEYWQAQAMARLARDLQAAADTGHELPEETLKVARDFLGVLVGR